MNCQRIVISGLFTMLGTFCLHYSTHAEVVHQITGEVTDLTPSRIVIDPSDGARIEFERDPSNPYNPLEDIKVGDSVTIWFTRSSENGDDIIEEPKEPNKIILDDRAFYGA